MYTVQRDGGYACGEYEVAQSLDTAICVHVDTQSGSFCVDEAHFALHSC